MWATRTAWSWKDLSWQWKLQGILKSVFRNPRMWVISATFHWSKQVTRPAQIQGQGDSLHPLMAGMAKTHCTGACRVLQPAWNSLAQWLIVKLWLMQVLGSHSGMWRRALGIFFFSCDCLPMLMTNVTLFSSIFNIDREHTYRCM